MRRYLKNTRLVTQQIVCDLEDTATVVLKVYGRSIIDRRSPVDMQQQPTFRRGKRRYMYTITFRNAIDADLFNRDLRKAYAKAKRTGRKGTK